MTSLFDRVNKNKQETEWMPSSNPAQNETESYHRTRILKIGKRYSLRALETRLEKLSAIIYDGVVGHLKEKLPRTSFMGLPPWWSTWYVKRQVRLLLP